MHEFLIVIPARYASSRFPGKVIAPIHGKPMMQYVWQTATQCVGPDRVLIAVDDPRVLSVAQSFGANTVMTSPTCASGTERCAQALELSHARADVVINMQADEPLIALAHVKALMQCFDTSSTQIATLCRPFPSDGTFADLADPNAVKVVLNSTHTHALMFSRSVIPYVRDAAPDSWSAATPFHIHMGIYAFRTSTLRRIIGLPPSALELAERLEQLRWLQAGIPIACPVITSDTAPLSFSVDTPDDLQRLLSSTQTPWT